MLFVHSPFPPLAALDGQAFDGYAHAVAILKLICWQPHLALTWNIKMD
jgi:hypothetical protein